MYSIACKRTHIDLHRQIHKQIYTLLHIHTHTYEHIHKHIFSLSLSYTNTNIQTHTHEHTHIYSIRLDSFVELSKMSKDVPDDTPLLAALALRFEAGNLLSFFLLIEVNWILFYPIGFNLIKFYWIENWSEIEPNVIKSN